MVGSLIALSFIMVPVLPTLNQDKLPAQVASYAFALAIPTLTFFLLMKRTFLLSKNKNLPVSHTLMGIIGILSAVIGLGSVFVYVLPKAAEVFVVASFICFYIFEGYEIVVFRDLREKEQPVKRPNRIYLLKKIILGKINRALFGNIKKPNIFP